MAYFVGTVASFTNNQQPKRYLVLIACFSQCHTLQQVYDFLIDVTCCYVTYCIIVGTVASFTNNQQPRRYLAFIACFSRCHTMQQVYDFLCNKLRFTREDMRLWKISSKDEVNSCFQSNLILCHCIILSNMSLF